MRYSRISFLGLAVCLHLSAVAYGQRTGFGGGGYFSLGGESAHNPGADSGTYTPVIGVYVEWLQPYFHPGLDLRAAGQTLGIHGPLVGPRVSITTGYGIFHPYAEILVGPNSAEIETNQVIVNQPGQPMPNFNRSGITLQGVIGADAELASHLRGRLEFTQSTFSGIEDSHPYAVTVGLVAHFR